MKILACEKENVGTFIVRLYCKEYGKNELTFHATKYERRAANFPTRIWIFICKLGTKRN